MARQEGGVPMLTAAAAAAALTSVERPEKEPPKRPLNEIAARPSNDVIFGTHHHITYITSLLPAFMSF